jgi:hypothetical protein
MSMRSAAAADAEGLFASISSRTASAPSTIVLRASASARRTRAASKLGSARSAAWVSAIESGEGSPALRSPARRARRRETPIASGCLRGDQRPRFGGEAVGDGVPRGGGERGFGIAALGVRHPGVERGGEDHERPGRERCDRGAGSLRVVPSCGIGERDQRGIGRGYAGPVQYGGGSGGERHVAGLQRLAVGADRDDGVGGRCRQHLGIAGGGNVRLAGGVGGAGLQIGGKITGLGRGASRCGGRQDETECEECELTCLDNWGLRRPRVRPS